MFALKIIPFLKFWKIEINVVVYRKLLKIFKNQLITARLQVVQVDCPESLKRQKQKQNMAYLFTWQIKPKINWRVRKRKKEENETTWQIEWVFFLLNFTPAFVQNEKRRTLFNKIKFTKTFLATSKQQLLSTKVNFFPVYMSREK